MIWRQLLELAATAANRGWPASEYEVRLTMTEAQKGYTAPPVEALFYVGVDHATNGDCIASGSSAAGWSEAAEDCAMQLRGQIRERIRCKEADIAALRSVLGEPRS